MTNKNKVILILGSVLGFFGVALGAFGAHVIKDLISADMLETYRTGILYHLIHAAVLTALGLSGQIRYYLSGIIMFSGVMLFSFSLYLYSITQFKPLVFLTPVGGILMLTGWLIIIYQTIKINNSK